MHCGTAYNRILILQPPPSTHYRRSARQNSSTETNNSSSQRIMRPTIASQNKIKSNASSKANSNIVRRRSIAAVSYGKYINISFSPRWQLWHSLIYELVYVTQRTTVIWKTRVPKIINRRDLIRLHFQTSNCKYLLGRKLLLKGESRIEIIFFSDNITA